MKKIYISVIAVSLFSCGILRAQEATPSGLLDAVTKGDTKTVRKYLSSDRALATSQPSGQKGSLIFWATILPRDKDGAAIISLLLDCGASPDDGNPLSMASGAGHLLEAKLLLQKHAKVDNYDNNGKTPLMLAAEDGFPKVVKLLLENGANINIKDNEGKTALDWATAPPDNETGKPSRELGKEAKYKEVVKMLRNFHQKNGNT
jgi:ankyrin repeat protein